MVINAKENKWRTRSGKREAISLPASPQKWDRATSEGKAGFGWKEYLEVRLCKGANGTRIFHSTLEAISLGTTVHIKNGPEKSNNCCTTNFYHGSTEWAARLLGYRFNIVYKHRLENRGYEALSRRGEGELCSLLSYPVWEDRTQLIEKVHQDVTSLRSWRKMHLSKPGFCYKGVSCHCLGAFCFHRTYRGIAGNVYWVGMKEYVWECDVCLHQQYVATLQMACCSPWVFPTWFRIKCPWTSSLGYRDQKDTKSYLWWWRGWLNMAILFRAGKIL